MGAYFWQWECFESVVNALQMNVVDAGPLHSPVRDFKITRNDKLGLILETISIDANPNHTTPYPPGTVRATTEQVKFSGHAGAHCTAYGVSPFNQNDRWNADHRRQTTEHAKIRSLQAELNAKVPVAYTIDWLENLDKDSGIWMGSLVSDFQDTTDRRVFGRDSGGVEFSWQGNTRQTISHTVLEMIIADVRLYLCVANKEFAQGFKKPGYILYFGDPDDETREKIREVLSFCLGNYLIYLGSTKLGQNNELVSITAESPPSIGRIQDIFSHPPAPLGETYVGEVNQQTLERMANAIYGHYDELKFRSLSWAYWHALCAPIHMAAVHFGAATELLMNAYVDAHPEKFEKKLLSNEEWEPLKKTLLKALSKAKLEQSTHTIFANKIQSNLNQAPADVLSDKIFSVIGISLGQPERAARKRRNLAAHGKPVDEDSAIPTIRENKLLKIILNRLVLKITNASESYYDDYTIGHARRHINEPVPN